MTLSYFDKSSEVQLNGSGFGVALLKPDVGQYWLPTFVHVGTSTFAGSASVHIGGIGVYDFTTQVDFTFAGGNDTTAACSGMIVSPGMSIAAQFSGGTANDTALMRVVGVSSDVPPTIGIDPGIPGHKFSGVESTVLIAGQPIGVNETNKQLFANQSPVGYAITLAAGVSTTLVPATAGKTVFLHGWDLSLDTGGNTAPMTATLQDTNGSLICDKRIEWQGTPTAAYIPPQSYIDFKGAPLSSGVGVVLKNNGTVQMAFFGTLLYSS